MNAATLLCVAILFGIAVEAMVLATLHRLARVGATLVAGGALVGALIAALQSVPLGFYACLAVSLVAHVLDLRGRWRE